MIVCMYVCKYVYFCIYLYIHACSNNSSHYFSGGSSSRCSSMEEGVVKNFLGLWGRSAHLLGGQIGQGEGVGLWWPDKGEGPKLVLAALEVRNSLCDDIHV